MGPAKAVSTSKSIAAQEFFHVAQRSSRERRVIWQKMHRPKPLPRLSVRRGHPAAVDAAGALAAVAVVAVAAATAPVVAAADPAVRADAVGARVAAAVVAVGAATAAPADHAVAMVGAAMAVATEASCWRT
jgi:hypothetical protein